VPRRSDLDATDIVIAAPLYWYSVPASVKSVLRLLERSGCACPAWISSSRWRASACMPSVWSSDEDFSVGRAASRGRSNSPPLHGMEWRGMLTGTATGRRRGPGCRDRARLSDSCCQAAASSGSARCSWWIAEKPPDAVFSWRRG
jgi:hypothetical protein